MIFFAGVFLIPMVVAAVAYFLSEEITWRELLVQAAAQLVVAIISALVVYHANTSDEEMWTGVVTKKQMERVSCSHSYPCNCMTTCDAKNNCSTTCQTCYDHTWDYNWAVYFSTGDELDINRVDRQGTHEPPRFTAVRVGEPAAVEHGYTNYVKAAPDTLFRRQGLVEKYQTSLPAYPGKVYDYYRIDRFVPVDFNVTDQQKWNEDIFALNAEIGNQWQADVAVVLTHDKPREWFFALEEKWLGGKKNDVIVVINTSGQSVEWVEVMAWVKDPIFKIKLRDSIMTLGTPASERVVPAIRQAVVTSYKRKPMADYAYLKSSIRPSGVEWLVSLLIGFVVAVGLSFVMHREDLFGENGRYFGRRRFGRAW